MNPKHFAAVVVLLATVGAAVRGQEAAGADAVLEPEVKAEIQARVDAEAAPEVLAREAKLAWPLTTPTKTVAQVSEAIETAVEKEVARKYAGADDVGKLGAETREKFRVFKVGDRVSFRTMAPLGKDAPVDGILVAVSEQKIHVGSRWIDRGDVPEEIQARFYPDLAARAADQYVKAKLAAVKKAREAYAAAGHRKLTPIFFGNAGYAQHPDTGAWTASQEVIELLRERKIAAITTEIGTARGYILKDGQWTKKTFLEKINDTKNTAVEKVAERKAERQKAAQEAEKERAAKEPEKAARGEENDKVWGEDEE
ncbi:MAG: hypothetical protein A3K19_33820 [Lentisphaerae bacterium RIFOXYB12_FULL_65_16]|nr:MAG: hypothetical protein A3K19_22285 [Lentisphaerae bacterium RIFOXYB12_FULL_65_16]OGV95245.1 MAG: hypothetical protein A3K19_33820 [Lentisphaerae bacterium RIFOXYB12_FULL_65_16]